MIDVRNREIVKPSNPGKLVYSIKNRLSISFSEANNSGHEVEGGSKVLNL